MTIGQKVAETGTLLRSGSACVLRRDFGGRYNLELNRVPVDHVEKRVRIVGTLVAEELVNVDGIAPA